VSGHGKRIFWLVVVNGLTTFRNVCSGIMFLADLSLLETFGVALAGGLSDIYDGRLAAIYNVRTVQGGIYDKLSDKIYMCACIFRLYHLWGIYAENADFRPATEALVIILIILESLIILGALCVKALNWFGSVKWNAEFEANQWGRWKMGFEVSAICALVVALIIHDRWLESLHLSILLVNILLLIADVLAVISIIVYIKNYLFKKEV